MDVDALRFRPATPDDAATLGRLNHALIRDEGHPNPMTVDELAARMQRWLADEGYEALLGHDEASSPVAYVLWRDQGETVWLRQIFVERDFRRQGAARQLMLSLIARWPDKRLTVDVPSGNARALAFWRRMGYQDCAVTLERLPHAR